MQAPARTRASPAPSHARRYATSEATPSKQSSTPITNPYANRQNPSGLSSIAAHLRAVSPSTTETYVAYGGTEDLFLECSRQCNYTIPSARAKPPTEPPLTASGEELGVGSGWWLEPKSPHAGLGLTPTFNTWAQVMFLHMWLLTVRFRCFPQAYVKHWDQHLLDHFFYAAEDRMAVWHRMTSRGVRNKYLKDLWTQWRGVLLSYDEGLIKGDAVLAAAVWRNIFKADEGVNVSDLATVTEYIMRELKALGALTDQTIIEGRIKFGDPKSLRSVGTGATVGVGAGAEKPAIKV